MTKKKLVLYLVMAISVLLVLPYLVVEVKTLIHGEEVEDLYSRTDIIGSNNYCKVLDYSKDQMVVIYADTKSVNKCYFGTIDGIWILESWETIYSTQGSASEFHYPVYFPKQTESEWY